MNWYCRMKTFGSVHKFGFKAFIIKETRDELHNSLLFDMNYQTWITNSIFIYIHSFSMKDICEIYCSIIEILWRRIHNIKSYLPTLDDKRVSRQVFLIVWDII